MLTVIKTYDTNTVSIFDHNRCAIVIHTTDIPALIKLLKDARRPPKKSITRSIMAQLFKKPRSIVDK